MAKEKVVFANSTLKAKKKKLELPIEFYYSKTWELYVVIGAMFGISILFSVVLEISEFRNNIWVGLTVFVLSMVVIYKFIDLCKSMQYDNPHIIIEKDCLYLLYDDYVDFNFDKIENIELTSKWRSSGMSDFLTITILEEYRKEYGVKNGIIDYSMWSGYLYVGDKSIEFYQAFDLIWQVFWNYQEETNYPLRLRKKEEWEWWE